MATQFNPTNPAKSNQFWDFSTKRFASRFFFQVQILGGQSDYCSALAFVQTAIAFFPSKSAHRKHPYVAEWYSPRTTTVWKLFGNRFQNLLPSWYTTQYFLVKTNMVFFAIAILLLTEGLFCHHRICKKNRGVKSSQGTNQTFGSTSRMERLHNFIRWFYVGGPKAS